MNPHRGSRQHEQCETSECAPMKCHCFQAFKLCGAHGRTCGLARFSLLADHLSCLQQAMGPNVFQLIAWVGSGAQVCFGLALSLSCVVAVKEATLGRRSVPDMCCNIARYVPVVMKTRPANYWERVLASIQDGDEVWELGKASKPILWDMRCCVVQCKRPVETNIIFEEPVAP